MWNYRPYMEFVKDVVRTHDAIESDVAHMLDDEIKAMMEHHQLQGRNKHYRAADEAIANCRAWLGEERIASIDAVRIATHRRAALYFQIVEPR